MRPEIATTLKSNNENTGQCCTGDRLGVHSFIKKVDGDGDKQAVDVLNR